MELSGADRTGATNADGPSRKGVSWGRRRTVKWGAAAAVLAVLGAPVAAMADPGNANANDPNVPVIVEVGHSGANAAAGLVDGVAPGLAKKSLDIINGVAVSLPQHLITALQNAGAVVVPDVPVGVQSSTYGYCPGPTDPSTPSPYFTQDTGANLLAQAGNTGQGVGVAVLDTGINASLPDLAGHVTAGVDLTVNGIGNNYGSLSDQYGHGTFVAGLIAGNGAASGGTAPGMAPGAQLISIKAAGSTGTALSSTIVQGLQWAVKNKWKYNISVLNLSFGTLPTGPTSTEPMDQAVEQAWQAGITVIVSAGNAGPFNGTILSPGDDPLAITVGAFADNDSPQPLNWGPCPFSSAGPTAYDGWFKPDLTAPGRSVISLADPGSTIYTNNPSAIIGTSNFVGSGTSFSAAITSGAAALVLAAHPGVTPNEVKGRLLGNAMPGLLGNPFVGGHGELNAYYAATGPTLVLNQTVPASGGAAGVFNTVSLGSSWNGSSWNGSSWNGSSWNGSSWNGSSWNGSSWNGSSWNGSSWNGSSWNGSSWNGSSWNGSSWNGAGWTGSSWNGSSWNGSSWNGSSWNGSSWNGSSWNGMIWDGSSWNGSSWNGSSWNGSSWNGSSWNGSSWNGSSWNGSSWNGSSWNGSSWNGSSWNGSSWN